MELFGSMEASGLRRDAITYSSTISSLAKGKQWSLALQARVIPCQNQHYLVHEEACTWSIISSVASG